MGRKYTIEKVRNIFKDTGCELLSDVYEGAKGLLDYICNCGNVSKISLSSFLSGCRCKKCGIKKNSISRRKSYEEVVEIFRKEGCELLSKKYVTNADILNYKCNCGNISKTRLSNFMRGHKCRKCGNVKISKTKTFSYKRVKDIFEENNCELLDKIYINSRSKLKYKCQCGNLSKIRFSDFRQDKRCKKCGVVRGAEKQRYSYVEVKKIFKEKDCKLLSKVYENAHVPLEYICNCGQKSKINLNHFKRGQRCYKCAVKKRSGKNSCSYKPDLTDEERKKGRYYPEYTKWRKKVYKRDNYTCQKCDQKGGILNAHHIENYSSNKKLRLVIDNGITLCKKCHKKFHKKYGIKNNTKIQLNEFVNILIYSKVI